MSELVLERFGLHKPPELVNAIYGSESPRSDAAALSDLVEQAAEQRDSVAIAILEESSRELARDISIVYSKLGTSPVPLVITGGTILHGKYLKQAFNRACETQGLAFTTIHYVAEPAEGALQLARKIRLS